MKKSILIVMMTSLLATVNLAYANDIKTSELEELQTVDYVDINRYLGKWYDIASIPQRFSRGCTNTTAEYALKKNGEISVVNECIVDGKLNVATGSAKVTDTTTNAKLSVQFFWPFKGKYWIIELGDDYEYALVGHPDRNYFWFLSRTPDVSTEFYNEVMLRVQQKYGYRVSKIQRVIHDKDE